MLTTSQQLYKNIKEALSDSELNKDEYIKSILSEIVIVKCSEEIKKKLTPLVYDYLSLNREYALDLLNQDDHVMPRKVSSIKNIFCSALDSSEQFASLDLITRTRHNICHSPTLQNEIYFDNLIQEINKADDVLEKFKSYIDTIKNNIKE